MTYIAGGSPSGTDIVYEGCTDKSPPVNDIRLALPHSLYFAGWSDRSWGGTAAAFISLEALDLLVLARAYLITPQQFAGIVMQENAHDSKVQGVDLDIAEAKRTGHSRMLKKGYYSELIYLGDRDGYPILSFTASENRTDYNQPSAAYLRMICSGLQEAHGLSISDAVEYFKNRPGVLGKLTIQQLLEVLGYSDE